MNALRIPTLLALLLALVVLPSQAQQISTTAPMTAPELNPRLLGQQLAASLDSDVENIRGGTLLLVNHYANSGAARVDFRPVVPALHKVYRRDPVEQYRFTSVATLHAIGAEANLWHLADAVLHEPSARVQRLTLAALVDRYGVDAVAQNKKLVRLARHLARTRPHVEVGPPVLISSN